MIKPSSGRAPVLVLLAAALAVGVMAYRAPAALPAEPAAGSAPGRVLVEPVFAGRGQRSLVGIIGGVLEDQLKVRVTLDGEPLPGADVRFDIRPTKVGEIAEKRVRTGADGIASTSLTLSGPGGDYFVTAAYDGPGGEAVAEINLKVYERMWLYFLVFGTLGGLAIFLYGMEISAEGLQKAAGDKMRAILGRLTSNRVMGVLVGTLVTAAVQSSSATTVMAVGFVTAMLMTLPQAVGVIMGANVGTTLTVQLIAFNIADYAPLMIGLGYFMGALGGRRPMLKHLGTVILGFGFIFFGMAVMSGAMKPLRSIQAFTDLLAMCGNYPALGILVSAVFTAVVQASAATIGIAIALAATGVVTLPAAIAIAFGSNVGTCATAMLSTLSASRDGKRVAFVHMVFNVMGVVIFYPFLGVFAKGVERFTLATGSTSLVRQIANAHMFFNVVNTIIFLPFVNQLSALARKVIPDPQAGEEVQPPFQPKYLEKGLQNPPDIALEQGFRETLRMGGIVDEMLQGIMDPLLGRDEAGLAAVKAEDDKVDILRKALSDYFAQLSRKELSPDQSEEMLSYMYAVDYFENIADVVAKELAALGGKLAREEADLDPEQVRIIRTLHGRVLELFEKNLDGMRERSVEPAEEVMLLYSKLKVQMRRIHQQQLQCLGRSEPTSPALAAIYFDIIESLRSIASRISQIAHNVSESA